MLGRRLSNITCFPLTRATMWLMVLILPWACPGFAGTCQDVDGTVQCTDDAGRDPTLQSLDKAFGNLGPLTTPSSYPEALKTYSTDIKTRDQGREGERPSSDPDEDVRRTTLQGPSPKAGCVEAAIALWMWEGA